MAIEQTESAWLPTLEQAIELLTRVRDAGRKNKLHTAEELLTAAKQVEDAVRLLEPSARQASDEQPLGVVTSLVRRAREPSEGRPATWGAVSQAMGLSLAQRGFDKYAGGIEERRASTRERVYRHRDPNIAPRSANEPGLSASEAEAHYGFSRTKLRAWVAEEKVHAWPLMNEAGTPVMLRRAGKEVPSLRFFTDGYTASDAASKLGITEDALEEMGQRGEIGRSLVLGEDWEPLLDSDGSQVWQYFPDHRSPASAK